MTTKIFFKQSKNKASHCLYTTFIMCVYSLLVFLDIFLPHYDNSACNLCLAFSFITVHLAFFYVATSFSLSLF